MREYLKPSIEEEVIELDDVIAASNGGKGDVDKDGDSVAVGNIWN